MWTLDPIDGTKGFLRGGQYAVCLALLVDARVELGIIGCPNLPIITPSTTDTDATTTTTTNDDKGALFVAVRGHGAHQLPLSPRETDAPSTPQQLHMPRLALHDLAFLESVEKAHAALDTNARTGARLGVRAAPVRMDSQAKYAALARGDSAGGVYLRLPVARGGGSGGYQEKIWVRVSCLGSLFNDLLIHPWLLRITRRDRCSSRRPAASFRIIVGALWTLDLGGRSARTLVSLRRGRRCMRR